MPEETKLECPDCGTSVKESDTKCPGCGAVFEDDAKEDAGATDVAVVTAENVEDESSDPEKDKEDIKAKEDADEKTEETDKEEDETPDEGEKEPPAGEPMKAGLNKVGIVVSALGILGVLGAVLLDPVMNILDSKHSSAIIIGPTQMAGVLAAAVVLVVGLVITFAMRKRTVHPSPKTVDPNKG
jgi:hypothetical protein